MIKNVIDFCNQNIGFVSAIFSTITFFTAFSAIVISISTSKKQEKLALYEKRVEIFVKVKSVCHFFEIFQSAKRKGSYDLLAWASIYKLGTPEEQQFKKIMQIKRKIRKETDAESLEKLEKELLHEADKMWPFCVREMEYNSGLQNSVHFLFKPNIEKRICTLLHIYETFVFGHPVFSDEEYEDFWADAKKHYEENDGANLLNDMEKEIWKYNLIGRRGIKL